MRSVLAALALVVPGLAAAQAAITSGLTQPATSPAFVDGPAASVVNPAGVGFHEGFSLRYLHEDRALSEGGAADIIGNGLYLALGNGRGVGASLSFEWLSSRLALAPSAALAGTDRRTTWALALGAPPFSIGGSLHLYEGDTPGIDPLVSGDLGLMSRGSRFFSSGFVVRDVASPHLRGARIPRSYVLGLGFRPMGSDAATIGVDASLLEKAWRGRESGFDGLAVGASGSLRVSDGVFLQGRFDRQTGATRFTSGQVGLALDFEHFALASSAIRPGADATGLVVAAQLSSASLGGIDPRPPPRVAVIDLDEELAPSSGLIVFGPERHPVIETVVGLATLARDPDVDGVVLKMGSLQDVGFGNAYELRQGILGLRAAGKKVAVLLTAAGDAEYYVASAADQVWTTRGAALLVNGLMARALFFGGTLKHIGIAVDAVRIGAYKNAPDQLVRSDATPEQQEVTNALLDSTFNQYVQDVSASRKLDPAAFRKALDVGVLSASQAKDLGLVDLLVYPDELEDSAAKLVGESHAWVYDSGLPEPHWDRWGPAPTIAIVPVEGLITMGTSGGDPFGFVHTSGAETVVEALEQAAKDPTVAAIVLRVDSGGGDAQASDLIWRAVRKASEKKPVVASMGDVAASGGYYAAVGTKTLFASPTTITGSIGIFAMKPAVKGLLDMIDAGVFTAKRGENADIFGLVEPWSEGERRAMEGYIRSSYQDFLKAVSDGRPLSVEQVDAVGQGRVWTGQQALERKLVDRMGGLAEALDAAAAEAGIARDLVVEYRVLAPAGGLFRVGTPGAQVPDGVKQVVRATVPKPLLVPGASGMWAYLPWEITLE